MKSKILSLLVAGFCSMALHAEAAMIQWTFSGQVAPIDSNNLNDITNVLGTFTFDDMTQTASNFVYTIGGNSMTLNVISTEGFGSDGVGINYGTDESIFLSAVRIEHLAMPGELTGGLIIPLGNIYYSNNLPVGGSSIEMISYRGEYINNVSTVPLPASALLFAPAVVGLFGLRRKEII